MNMYSTGNYDSLPLSLPFLPPSSEKKAAETELTTVQTDRDTLSARTAALEGEVKRMRRELEEEREKITQMKDAEVCVYVCVRVHI